MITPATRLSPWRRRDRYLFSQRAVFLLVPVFALAAAAATLSIPHSAIDQDRARGLRGAALHCLGSAPWLIGVQLLEGLDTGIFGAITPLVIADLMRGTGRYSLAQGAVATVQGLSASLSGLISGVVVDHLGYTIGFLSFDASACVTLAALWLAMPETAPKPAASASVGKSV